MPEQKVAGRLTVRQGDEEGSDLRGATKRCQLAVREFLVNMPLGEK